MPRGHELPRERVAADLRKRIKAGEWKQGEAIDTVATLADHYQVSQGTVSAAIRVLVDEGLLLTRPRWATTVR
jgi:DNA-binding GntR family transcriptional regulator